MNTVIEWMNLWGARFTGFALPMLLQSTILIGVCLLLDWTLRDRVRATIRYAVWMLALVKLVTPTSLSSPTSVAYWVPEPAIMRGAAVIPTAPVAQPSLMGATPPESAPVPAAKLTAKAFVFGAWFLVMVSLALWVLVQWRRVLAMVGQSTVAPRELQELADDCQRQLGIAWIIPVRSAPAASSPAICGVWRPIILIPEGLDEILSPSEMRSVLLHELAHFKRGDLWVNQLQILLQIVYWYNPLLWLANARIRRVREQAVDEMVLVELREEAEVYPAALLRVAKQGLQRPMASIGFLGILQPGRSLTQRIRNMVERPLPTTARIGLRGLASLCLFALVMMPMACHQKNDPIGAVADKFKQEVYRRGSSLTPAEVAAHEATLLKTPEDLTTRVELLVYYQRAQFVSPEARTARQKHALWMAEHHPESEVPAPFTALDPQLDGAAYQQGSEMWLKQVKSQSNNTRILAHAADYFLIHDRNAAENLLKQAQKLEPKNPAWSEKLGQLYVLESGPGPANAVKALAEFEHAQAQSGKAQPEFAQLDSLAKAAYAAGDYGKARKYALDLLAQAEGKEKEWNYGNAIQHGNSVLGRLALREGKVDEAKNYLLAAGKTPGSPQLNSFGPNMSLAKDLLEQKESAVVLEYFEQCRKFWSMGGEKLDRWSGEVKAGLMPDFGAHLAY